MADFSVRGALRALRAWQGSPAAWVPALRAVWIGCLASPLIALALHSAMIVPRARQTGGSLWFFTTVRGDYPQAYDSGHAELRFAASVRRWTTRSTGVMLHPSLDKFVLEARFDATLDRLVRRVQPGPLVAPSAAGVDGWVAIGLSTELAADTLLDLAGDHALTLYDHYFMIDLRRSDRSVRVLQLATFTPPWHFLFLDTSFELPVRTVRNVQRERELGAQRAARSALGPAPVRTEALRLTQPGAISKL